MMSNTDMTNDCLEEYLDAGVTLTTRQLSRLLEEARKDEREACALACDAQAARFAAIEDGRSYYATKECAASIRARKST